MSHRKIKVLISLPILLLPIILESSPLNVSEYDSMCIKRGTKRAFNKNIVLLKQKFSYSFLDDELFLDSVYYIDLFANLYNGNGNKEFTVYNAFSPNKLNSRFISLVNNYDASRRECNTALACQHDNKWRMKLMVPVLFLGTPIGMIMSITEEKGSPYINILGVGILIGSIGYSGHAFFKFFHNQYMFEKCVDQAIYRYSQERIIRKANE